MGNRLNYDAFDSMMGYDRVWRKSGNAEKSAGKIFNRSPHKQSDPRRLRTTDLGPPDHNSIGLDHRDQLDVGRHPFIKNLMVGRNEDVLVLIGNTDRLLGV